MPEREKMVVLIDQQKQEVKSNVTRKVGLGMIKRIS